MHRRLIAGSIVVLTVLALAGPAAADGTGDAFNDGDEIGAEVDLVSGGSGGSGSGGKAVCHYRRLDEGAQAKADQMAEENNWSEQPGDGPGAWYQLVCELNGLVPSVTIVWLPDAAVDPEALAQQALDRTLIPAPEIRLNPPEGRDQVVNVPTWMWIDPASWAPVSATAAAGGVTVTATATPTTVSWDMGNGEVVTCDGPGTPYDQNVAPEDQQSECTYTYRRSSAGHPGGAFTMRVTTTWGVTWTVSGAPGGGSLGTAQRTTTSAVRVAEIQAVNEQATRSGAAHGD
jgi:hypothetical protein